MTNNKLLSDEMRAVADALLSVRARLIRMMRDGPCPADLWPDISVVQVDGLLVADALERLANDRTKE